MTRDEFIKELNEICDRYTGRDLKPEPVIKAGDTVRCPDEPCNPYECEVIRIRGDIALLVKHELPACVCAEETFSDLTLIRKGPKVHTFEKVGIWGRQIDSEEAICYPCPAGITTEAMLGELTRNGKRYTMTLTEEE